MASYVEKLNGYIADNPNIDFERCDGKVFSFYEVNTASISDSAESLTINGGQSNFPLAIIDTTRNLEMTFDSSEFTMDMFAMANATDAKAADAAYDMLESDLYEVEDDGVTLNIPCKVTTGSVKISGFESADAAAEGKFKVEAVEAADTTPASTKITFATNDVKKGDVIRVAYRRVIGTSAHVVEVKTNSTTAKGEATFHWPVYSAGTDCTEAAQKGTLHLKVFRVRVTALPGMDNSYKSAATNGVTFTALDPKRADKKMCEWVYEEL